MATNRQNVQNTQEDLSPTNQPVNPYEGAQYVPMPAGGLRGLALEVWPSDADDPEAMQQHVADLMQLNAGILRNEDSWTVGQMVRIQ